MTRYYASLCDIAYLPKLVALYESLIRHSSANVSLYVLALTEETRVALTRLNLEHVIAIQAGYFERQMNLAEVKKSRTWQEWCWSCSSLFCEFLMATGLREISYCDADLFFYSNPEPIFDEIGQRSIAITPHRFIEPKKYLAVNGAYNVGFLNFKSTAPGRDCLSKWAANVRDWCFNRVEPTRFADQKYLDYFQQDFGDEVCILSRGVNAGPWSIGNWSVTEGPKLDGEQLITYHMHEFLKHNDGHYTLSNYSMRLEDIEFVYQPYLRAYRAAEERIEAIYIST